MQTGKRRLKGELIFLTLVVLLLSSCELCKFSGRWLGSMYFEEFTEGYQTIYLGLELECEEDYINGKGYFASGSLSKPEDVWHTSFGYDASGEVLGDGAYIRLKRCTVNWLGQACKEYFLNGYLDKNTLSGDVVCVQTSYGGSRREWSGLFSVTRY